MAGLRSNRGASGDALPSLVRPANRSGNGDDQSFALVIALRSMSQCSITGEEVRANNAGGIARTIGGIKRNILRRTLARTLDAKMSLYDSVKDGRH